MILHLSLLGWTQEEIGEKVDESQQNVAKILQQNYGSEFSGIFFALIDQGHSLSEIAKHTTKQKRPGQMT